jgi:hypothetical protein
MTDGAVRMRPRDATHASRDSQRTGNRQRHKEHRHQEPEGTWTPGRARHGPPREEASLATMFDRLAEAAAAHDGEAPAGIFGESG